MKLLVINAEADARKTYLTNLPSVRQVSIKAAPGLQKGKWGSEDGISDSGEIIKSLSDLRKSFVEKMSTISNSSLNNEIRR